MGDFVSRRHTVGMADLLTDDEPGIKPDDGLPQSESPASTSLFRPVPAACAGFAGP